MPLTSRFDNLLGNACRIAFDIAESDRVAHGVRNHVEHAGQSEVVDAAISVEGHVEVRVALDDRLRDRLDRAARLNGRIASKSNPRPIRSPQSRTCKPSGYQPPYRRLQRFDSCWISTIAYFFTRPASSFRAMKYVGVLLHIDEQSGRLPGNGGFAPGLPQTAWQSPRLRRPRNRSALSDVRWFTSTKPTMELSPVAEVTPVYIQTSSSLAM